jgi:hypothetical protein
MDRIYSISGMHLSGLIRTSFLHSYASTSPINFFHYMLCHSRIYSTYRVHLPISSGIQDLQRLRGAPVGQIKTKGHLAPSQVEAGFTALLGCTCKPTLKGRIYSTLGCTCQGFCVFSFVRRDNGIPRGTVSFSLMLYQGLDLQHPGVHL